MLDIQERSNWKFPHLFGALFIALILQVIFLPCLCKVGTAKMALAGLLDVLILLRILAAYISKEQSNGWKFYCFLSVSSFIWIRVVTSMVLWEWH